MVRIRARLTLKTDLNKVRSHPQSCNPASGRTLWPVGRWEQYDLYIQNWKAVSSLLYFENDINMLSEKNI